MSVCKCCVFSNRGLCNELITRPEESNRLWWVVVFYLETSWMRRPWPTGGLLRQKRKNTKYKSGHVKTAKAKKKNRGSVPDLMKLGPRTKWKVSPKFSELYFLRQSCSYLLLLLALQPTRGFSLLSRSLPFYSFVTLLSPPSYSNYLHIFFNVYNPSLPWSSSNSRTYRFRH